MIGNQNENPRDPERSAAPTGRASLSPAARLFHDGLTARCVAEYTPAYAARVLGMTAAEASRLSAEPLNAPGRPELYRLAAFSRIA